MFLMGAVYEVLLCMSNSNHPTAAVTPHWPSLNFAQFAMVRQFKARVQRSSLDELPAEGTALTWVAVGRSWCARRRCMCHRPWTALFHLPIPGGMGGGYGMVVVKNIRIHVAAVVVMVLGQTVG